LLSAFSLFDVITDILMTLIWIAAAVIVGLRLLAGEPRNVNNPRHRDDYEVDRQF